MNTLRNVGEIRDVFDYPTDDKSLENISEKFAGYDYQETFEAFKFLSDNINSKENLPDFSNTKWEVISDKRDLSSTLSLVRKGKNIPTIYAYIWFKNNSNGEIGFSYMRPNPDWIEQAKGHIGEQNDQKQKPKSNDIRDSDYDPKHNHKHNIDKYETDVEIDKDNTNRDDTNEDIEFDKNVEDNGDNVIETDISKSDLIVLLKARISNVLHASDDYIDENSQEISDYYHLSQGYPNVVPILQDIYDIDSLKKNIKRFSFEFSEEEINEICRVHNIKPSNDSNSITEENINDNNLEFVLED